MIYVQTSAMTQDNDAIGWSGAPNDLHYSLFDGVSWSPVADIATRVEY